MASPSDPAAHPICGPGTSIQRQRAPFWVLPHSAAQSQHVQCPGILLRWVQGRRADGKRTSGPWT